MRFRSPTLDYEVFVHNTNVERHGAPLDPLGQVMVAQQPLPRTLRSRIRQFIQANPNYTRSDVRRLIDEWDAEQGKPKTINERRVRTMEALALRSTGYARKPSMRERCAELMRSNPHYKLSDVQDLIAQWERERGRSREITRRRVLQLVSLTKHWLQRL